jgi:hypothetical protein
MNPEEIQKLLGGYATGTLTPEEQQALFQAALDDQELFDALAKEQSLRDLLRDPAARAQVLDAIDERPRPWWRRENRWVLIGAMAAACMAAATGIYVTRSRQMPHSVLIAETRQQPAPPPVNEMPKPEAAPAVREQTRHQVVQRPRTTRKVPPPQSSGGGGSGGHAELERSSAASPSQAESALHEEPAAAPRPAASPVTAPPIPSPATPPRVPAPTAETVAVTAAAPTLAVNGSVGGALPTQDARSLFYAGAQTQALPRQAGSAGAQFQRANALASLAVTNLGVKWTALRKQPDGLFSEVDSEQIKAGDVIKLRLVPNANGFLSVREGGRPLISDTPAVRLQPFETPEITSGEGKKELTILLAREAQQAKKEQAKQQQPAGLIRTAAADQLSQSDRNEHAVYEVQTGNNLFAPVLVRITLNFR